MSIKALDLQQKRYLAGLLELACQQLELTSSQYKDARGKYEAVSSWLARSPHFELAESFIFPQGSMRLGTTVRPLGRDEFDIDLVCYLVHAAREDYPYPDTVRNLVGERLRENGTYKTMLEPLNRGWRLNYAESSKFYLDITPSVHNPTCSNGGLLVPDKALKSWKPTHPRGYAEWFDIHTQLEPSYVVEEKRKLKADVEPLPDQVPIKGLLKRIVQISKRHRDLMFTNTRKQPPISIILTTLAAHAYADAVRSSHYVHELDLIYDVIAHMDRFIEISKVDGRSYYLIPNPVTEGENFAEKWNTDPQRANSFFIWQKQALRDLDELAQSQGLDTIIEHLKTRVIGPEAIQVMNIVTNRIGGSRSAALLRSTPSAGISLTEGNVVRANTFYGS